MAVEAPAASIEETRTVANVTKVANEVVSAANDAWLELTIVAKDDGRPLANVRPAAWTNEPPPEKPVWVDVAEGDVLHVPITRADGRARLRLRASVEHSMFVQQREAPGSYVRTSVPALAPGETRAMRIELPLEADVVFVGRVVAKANGEPIVGALVTTTRSTNGGAERLGPELRTDSSGLFKAHGESWKARTVQVDATGFGRRLAELKAGHETEEKAQRIELLPSAKLHVTVRGPLPAGSATPRVTAMCDALDIQQRESELYGFNSPEPVWSAEIGAEGTADLLDLPAKVPLRLSVDAGERTLAYHDGVIQLAEGEERSIELTIGSGATIHGIARDTSGAALAGASIWLTAERAGLLGFAAYIKPTASTTSDAEGGFTFTDVVVGRWLVGFAPEPLRESRARTPYSQRTVPVNVTPDDRDVQVELVASRDMKIAGRVVDADGHGIEGISVGAESVLGAVIAATSSESGEDGSFTVTHVAPGAWRVVARGANGWADSTPIVVEAGASDVELVLVRGGALLVEVVDEGGTRVPSCEVRRRADEFALDGSSTWIARFDGKPLRVDGLRPGTWTFVANAPDAIAVERVLVEASVEPRELRMRLGPSAKLDFRTTIPNGFYRVVVTSAGMTIVERFDGAKDESLVVVPVGDVRVDWRLGDDGPTRSREVRTRAGETLVVDLDAE